MVRAYAYPTRREDSPPEDLGGSKVKAMILDSLAVASFIAAMVLLLAVGSMR